MYTDTFCQRTSVRYVRIANQFCEDHAAAMCETMVISLPILSSYGLIRRVRVSLPLVPALLDDHKYALPDSLPPLSKTDAQPIGRQRLYHRHPGRMAGSVSV